MKFVLKILLSLLFVSLAYAEERICDGIIVQGKMNELTETEKKLVCGDKYSIAYKNIPAYEAQLFFTAFLQSRGQLGPKFEIVDEVLYVKPGKKFFVRKIKASSSNPEGSHVVKTKMYPLYKKKLLTPKTLTKMESQALGVRSFFL